MATAIDASCSLLDGKPASGHGEDECHTDDETDSESEAEGDVSDMEVAGPPAARLKSGTCCGILAPLLCVDSSCISPASARSASAWDIDFFG